MRNRQALRRTIIELARRRGRPGAGSPTAFLKERTVQRQFPDLSPVLGNLLWAVVGAAATRLYMPERATLDLDIAVRRADRQEVRRRLAAASLAYQGELSVGGSSWLMPDGNLVDVVELDTRWAEEALAEARGNRDRQGLPVLPMSYLVLMKFQSGRVQDLADVTRMLGQASDETLADVRQLFVQYLPSDLEDLESLITLGQMEMG